MSGLRRWSSRPFPLGTSALITLGIMLLAWGAGWGWHHYRPAVYEAKTRLRTDDPQRLKELLSDPKLLRAAACRCAAETTDPATILPLQGTCCTTLDGAGLMTVAYRTSNHAAAVAELTALIGTLESHLPAVDPHGAEIQLASLSWDQSPRREQLQAEVAEQEAQLAELDQHLADVVADPATLIAREERVKALGGRLAEARIARLEAERQFLHVRDCLENRRPLEWLASRLTDPVAQRIAETALEYERLVANWRDRQERLTRLAGIYGRNHPERVKLEAEIADLEIRMANQPAPGGDTVARMLALVTAFEGYLAERQEFERELQQQLDLEQQQSQFIVDLQKRCAAGHQRLEETRAALAAAAATAGPGDPLHQQTPMKVVESPWLSPHPVSSSLTMTMLLSTLIGAFFRVLLGRLWALFDRSPPSPPMAAPATGPAPLTRATVAERRQARLQQLEEARA